MFEMFFQYYFHLASCILLENNVNMLVMTPVITHVNEISKFIMQNIIKI